MYLVECTILIGYALVTCICNGTSYDCKDAFRFQYQDSCDTLQISCAAEASPIVLEKAMQFGLSRNSHVAMAFDDTKVKNRYTEADTDDITGETPLHHFGFLHANR